MLPKPLIGYIKSYIVLPSTIYGLTTGKLAYMGVQNRHSVQIPFLNNASLARGRAGIVGEGKNIWSNVNGTLFLVSFQSDINSSSLRGCRTVEDGAQDPTIIPKLASSVRHVIRRPRRFNCCILCLRETTSSRSLEQCLRATYIITSLHSSHGSSQCFTKYNSLSLT
jgi:hypothetical protein